MFAECSQCKYLFQIDSQDKLLCPVCGSDAVNIQGQKSPIGESKTPSSPVDNQSTSPQCPLHPANSATGTCSRCGNFVCQECSQLGANGELICDACRARTGAGQIFEPIPWEQRSSLGLVNALLKTIQLALLRPNELFSRMRVDNIDGALSYYWINAAAGGFFSVLWQIVLSSLGMASGSNRAIAGISQVLFYVLIALAGAVLAPIGLYLSALLFHLGTIIFKCSNSGFNATFRSVAYASSPAWINIIPVCGGAIAGIWSLIILTVGIKTTQRTSTGKAIASVLVPPLVLSCCVAVPIIVLFASIAGMNR